jgi:ABC-type uncharacterized transport system auxiliary subunit
LPTDHYYRLPELTGISPDEQRVSTISVIKFQADGLYKERAIVYSENEVELQQYHYHHWADSPARLLQERLAQTLRMANVSKMVLTTFEGNSELIINGQLKAFERTKNANHDSATISLHLRVDDNLGGLPVLYKEYNQTVGLRDSTIAGLIDAFNTAINSIYHDFYIDLKAVLLK